jgi:transposase
MRQLHEDESSQRLPEIPGIGPVAASVLATELGDAGQFAAISMIGVVSSAAGTHRVGSDVRIYYFAECGTGG